MEPLLEAEVPCAAGIDLSSTTDRHEGRCDVRLDEPVGRAILVFLCVKMFQGVFLRGAAPGCRGLEGGIDRPEFDGRDEAVALRHALLPSHTLLLPHLLHLHMCTSSFPFLATVHNIVP